MHNAECGARIKKFSTAFPAILSLLCNVFRSLLYAARKSQFVGVLQFGAYCNSSRQRADFNLGVEQFFVEVEIRRVAFHCWAKGKNNFVDFRIYRFVDQRLQEQVGRAYAVHRGNDGAEYVVNARIRGCRLNRHNVADIFHHADQPVITVRIRTNAARFGIAQVSAFAAELHVFLECEERFGKILHFVVAAPQQLQYQSQSGSFTYPGKRAQVLDCVFEVFRRNIHILKLGKYHYVRRSIRLHAYFCTMQEKIPFELFGLHLLEPMAVIMNFLLAMFCFFAYATLKNPSKDPALANWRLFYLVFGISTFAGALGHAFFNYWGFFGKFPCWTTGCVANAFAAMGMIQFRGFSAPNKAVVALIWIKSIAAAVLSLITLKFIFVAVDAIVTYLAFAGVFGYVLYKRGLGEMKYTVIGVLILLPSAPIFILKLNPHPWFNKDDLSHVLMLVCIACFYVTLKKWSARIGSAG